jgi:hypothetical protein
MSKYIKAIVVAAILAAGIIFTISKESKCPCIPGSGCYPGCTQE